MFEIEDETTVINAKLLLEGFWYSELPDILKMDSLAERLPIVLDLIKEKKATNYSYDTDNLIVGFLSIFSPTYIFKKGVEAIVYYTFKKNKSWREMQIPNLLHYMGFIYNSLYVFDELFGELYLNDTNSLLVESSNSYVVIGETFNITRDYDGESFDIEIGTFSSKNNKMGSSIVFVDNKKRYLNVEGSYIYSLKMDIESFYPNMYTHMFDKMKNYIPYSTLGNNKNYFKFLDTYNMEINSNQTKGIPAGVFSSHISSELFMLCVDFEIRTEIENLNIGYIRYVDDLTFFADSLKILDEVKTKVQKILNKYRLRINGNKTVTISNTHIPMLTDISEIYSLFPVLEITEEVKSLSFIDYLRIKEYVLTCLISTRTSQIKTLLSILTSRIECKKLSIQDCEYELFCYLLKLVWEDENLASHIYRLINEILILIEDKERYIKQLALKTEIIDSEFSDTLLQIWHYYVITQFSSDFEKTALFNIPKQFIYNPIIVAMFVISGTKKNSHIFKYIKQSYCKEDITEDWKSRIMFSKWWISLFKIKQFDNYNYDNFMNSEAFPKVLKEFTKSE